MHIIALGINHKTAALETREKVAFAEKHKAEAYANLVCGGPVKQCVILSTCNRTEIYALASDAEAGRAAAGQLWLPCSKRFVVLPVPSLKTAFIITAAPKRWPTFFGLQPDLTR